MLTVCVKVECGKIVLIVNTCSTCNWYEVLMVNTCTFFMTLKQINHLLRNIAHVIQLV